MATSYERMRPRSETTLRVEALLSRYPNLSEQELAELINLFPYLNLLDQGLMTSDDRLAGKLRNFHREHGRKLKTQMSGLIAFLSVPTLLALFILWWVFT
jgi:hypothetical protein